MFKSYYTTITYWNFYVTVIKKLLLLFNYYYYYWNYYSRTIFESNMSAWHSKNGVTVLLEWTSWSNNSFQNRLDW